MWNSEAPLKLLNSMPTHLTKENLEQIQLLIDEDKYINSSVYGYDLCGTYAPFCYGCDKELYCPCAVSYVKMKQAEGLNVEIAAADDTLTQDELPARKIRIAVAKRKIKV